MDTSNAHDGIQHHSLTAKHLYASSFKQEKMNIRPKMGFILSYSHCNDIATTNRLLLLALVSFARYDTVFLLQDRRCCCIWVDSEIDSLTMSGNNWSYGTHFVTF